MLKINIPAVREELFKEGRLPRISGATIVRNEPEWTHPLHMHKDTSDIVLITKGSGRLFCKNQYFNTRRGDIAIYNLGVIHNEESFHDDPLEFMALHFTDVRIVGLEPNEIISPYVSPVIKTGGSFQQFEALFEMIFAELEKEQHHSMQVCQSLGVAILSLINRLVRVIEPYIYMDEQNFSLSQRVMNYLDINYGKRVKLSDLEEQFHFSRSYITHLFKKETGFSPNQYNIMRRIGEAQKLLLSTDLSASEIARRCGYKDVTQFYSIFKKYKSVAPVQFRKENSKNQKG
ncbi:MAG: AraC family transcriptional regulator [Christensenellales bacterium]|jgi:AraC-like DNA-binding protein/mannose-6-phosphate isomerase-like protein (cupin superfamily)